MSDDVGFIQELYTARYRRLVGQLVGVAGDVATAEEVVQEAFMKALQKPRSFRQLENPEAWLRTVAVNAARSRWRRTGLWRTLAPKLATTPTTNGDLSESHVAVLDALRQLPPSQRDAVALHYLADLSIEQVADTLGIPTGTVKARLSRGRESLRPLLAGWHADGYAAGPAQGPAHGPAGRPVEGRAVAPDTTYRKEAPHVS